MFVQLAGRPARHESQAPHFGIGIDDDPRARSATSRTAEPTARTRPDELVADDHRRGRRVARRDVDDLDVRAADAARLDLDEDLVGGPASGPATSRTTRRPSPS